MSCKGQGEMKTLKTVQEDAGGLQTEGVSGGASHTRMSPWD
jgi:hypothetical protein